MSTAPLPQATETDTASVLGRSVVLGVLPTAVDTALPMAVELEVVPPFVPLVSAGTFPSSEVGGSGTYPGATTFPGAPLTLLAPVTGIAALPQASVETDTAFTARPLSIGVTPTAAEADLALPLTVLVDDGEYDDAISAADRVPVYTLKADWNRNGLYDHELSDLTDLVEQVSVDRTLSGSLPAEIGLVEGYSSAELSVTLSGTWRRRPITQIARTNLALNPSAETATTGYTVVTTGTMSSVAVLRGNSTVPVAGQYYLLARPVDDGTSGFAFLRCPLVPVTPGSTYTFSAYRQLVGTVATAYVGVDWIDGSGNQLPGTVNGAGIAGTGWARGYVTATAPTGAVYARQFLVGGTVNFANYVRWDGIMAEAGAALGDYFDGDSSGAQWNGAPHASTSSVLVETALDDDDTTFDPVDVFAPYRPDSPLYGRPVLRTPIYLETGFVADDGPRLTRRFTGTLTQVHPASSARTVELTAVDPVGALRQALTLSAVGMDATLLARVGPDAYRSRINSQWLIDWALRSNGFYTSPPARPDAILSVTGHGSMIPEVGWGGAPQEYYPTYRGDKWMTGHFGGALATVGGDVGQWWTSEQLTAASGTGFGFSMWMAMYPASGVDRRLFQTDLTFDQSWFINFGVDTNGKPYVDAFSAAGAHRATATGFTPPTSGQWMFVGAHVAFAATTMTVTFRVNGATYTATVTTGGRGGNWKPIPRIVYNFVSPFQNFQLWKSNTAPTAPWQGEDGNWIPQADLDPGTNELTGVPSLLGQDSWALIQQITDAEGSRFAFTEEGRPQFRTSKGDALYGRIQRVNEVVTADRNLADLVSTTDETTIRNVVNVKTKAVLVNDWSDYFQASTVDQFDTPPGTSVFDIPITSDVYEVPETRDAYGANASLGGLARASFVFYTNEEVWNDAKQIAATKDHIRLALVYAANPVEITVPANVPAVYIRVERPDVTTLRIYITNYSAQTVRFATPSKPDPNGILNPGQPGLIVPARVVEQGPEQIETYTDNGSVATYGPTSFDVGGSEDRWRQTPLGLRALATEVLAATANPVPVLDAVDVPHDPRRAIGQRLILTDPQGLGEVTASIVGLTNAYESGGAKDKITVRPIAPPGLGVLDDPTHGLLDATLVAGP